MRLCCNNCGKWFFGNEITDFGFCKKCTLEVKTRLKKQKALKNKTFFWDDIKNQNLDDKFIPYRDYLSGNYWKNLRQKKFAKQKNPKCFICQTNRNLQCHHIVYKNLGTETTGDLMVVCGVCHELLHLLLKTGRIKFSKKAIESDLNQNWHNSKSANIHRIACKYWRILKKRTKNKKEKKLAKNLIKDIVESDYKKLKKWISIYY